MEEQKSGALKIITPVATLVVGLVVGFMFGASGTNSEVAQLRAQIEAAKKFFPATPEMRLISGTVKSVSGNTVILESLPSSNPFEDLPKERSITVVDTTKLVSFEQKDQATFQKEMEAFSKQVADTKSAGVSRGMPPAPFSEKSIKLEDIKVGTMVSVEADENIKDKAAFVATKITMTVSAQLPVLPIQ